MSDRKHKYKRTYSGEEYCIKCGVYFEKLFRSSIKISKYENLSEIYADYVNRILPCLTDEEVIIKKALE